MLKYYTLALLVILLISSGCTQSQLASSHFRNKPPKPPKITFVRNHNELNNRIITTIRINNWIIGTLAPGEHITLEYPAGQHYITIKGKRVPLTFKNNREYFFLVDQKEDGSVSDIYSIYAKEARRFMDANNYHSSLD